MTHRLRSTEKISNERGGYLQGVTFVRPEWQLFTCFKAVKTDRFFTNQAFNLSPIMTALCSRFNSTFPIFCPEIYKNNPQTTPTNTLYAPSKDQHSKHRLLLLAYDFSVSCRRRAPARVWNRAYGAIFYRLAHFFTVRSKIVGGRRQPPSPPRRGIPELNDELTLYQWQ